jgi:pimeloyl-ACP methyl ester carboxylesterase
MLSLVVPLVTSAKVINLENYPNLNSFESTLSYTKWKGKRGRILLMRYQKKQTQKIVEFPFQFYEKDHSAPLIFLLSGLGGDHKSQASEYLATLLFNYGFNVIIIGSTFSPEFIQSASSLPISGQAKIDAKDLYEVLYNLKTYLKNSDFNISRWGILGYSYGALVGAHVAKIDDRYKVFNFNKYLLINPPVDVVSSLNVLDKYYSLFKSLNAAEKIDLFFNWNDYTNNIKKIDFSRPSDFDFKLKHRLSVKQVYCLLGKGFNDTLRLALRTLEKLPNANAKLKSTASRGYGYYANNTVLNYFKSNKDAQNKWLEVYEKRPISLGELNAQNSLTGLRSTLVNNKKIIVFHNLDDFLLSPKNLDFLYNNLGSRLVLFKQGGHVGNVWHPQYQKSIIQALGNSF